MAMSSRLRGGAARRGRSGNRPVYEDFKPAYEWKHEEGASILLYHLPGFLKEQIRIIAESKGVLIIQGERLVTSDKWSRFKEQVVVPEDCDMSETRAKFEGGILRIIMPKKIIAVEKRQPIEEQPDTTYQGPSRPSVKRPSVQPKPQHELQEDLPSKPTLPTIAEKRFGTPSIALPPPTPWTGGKTEPQPQRQHEATTSPTKLPPIDHSKQTNINQDNIYDDSKEKFVEDQKVQEDFAHIVGSKGGDKSKGMPTSLVKESEIKGKYDEAIHRTQEKHEMYADALDQEKESSHDLSKMNRFDNYKQVMKSGLPEKSLDEDRQLLVNTGAAILVILALGTSIFYSFGSSG